MFDKDELLQQKLEALTRGETLETLLSDIDETDQELEGLIRLASAIRSMPHPDPESDLRLEKAAMLTPEFVRKTDLLANRNGKVRQSAGRTGILDSIKNLLENRTARWAVPVLAGAFILMFVFLTSFGAGLWYAGPGQAQYATLQGVEGVVEVASDANDTGWKTLTNGDRIQSGDAVRTHDDSSAFLVFFDGSRVELKANTQIKITGLNGGYGKLLQVVLNQTEGKTVHDIIPFENPKARYVVYTPGGTASVHGTKFSIEVDETGRARFAVNHGKVLVSNDLSDIYLLSGQVTSSQAGQEIEGPDFQFTLQGNVEKINGSVWEVIGVVFEVDDYTQFFGDPHIGHYVEVEGRILQDVYWTADKITVVNEEEEKGSFTGVLEAIEEERWIIGGWTVLVDGDTELNEGIELHSTLGVDFTVNDDGEWQAVRITLLSPPQTDPLIPEPTPDPNANPSLSFEPDELEAQTCAATGPSIYEFGGYLINDADDLKDYAAGVELSYQLIKGAEYIDDVELIPFTWDRIEAGESEHFSIRLHINDTWYQALDGSEIKVRVFVSREINRPDHHPGRVTATLSTHCGDEPLDPGEPPPSEPIVTPDPDQEIGEICVGVDPHPTGMRLAERYDVPYEEILGWFCQRFGFGEIDLAYSLSIEFNVPVEDIFAMKSSGMGWGDIRQELVQNDQGESPELEETSEPIREGDATCVGAQPHPTGMRLAERYGVTYDEIMDWFCQGFGFGEIDLAYSLSRDTGIPVKDIFNMKTSGEGWGNIQKELQPKQPGPPDRKGPPENPGPPINPGPPVIPVR